MVPGGGGWVYRAGLDVPNSFPRVVVSPDGQHWAVAAWCKSGGNERLGIVHGAGLSRGGNDLVARVAGPSHVAGRVVDRLETSISVNSAGQVAYAGSITGSTTDDQFVVRWAAGLATEWAREGQQVPGTASGVQYGDIIDGTSIAENGAVTARAFLAGAANGHVWLRLASPTAGAVLAQTGVTTPWAQLAQPPQPVSGLVFDRCAADQSGSSSFLRVTLGGPSTTDQAATFSGGVVAQEGVVLPGSPFAVGVMYLAPQRWGLALSPGGGHWGLLGSNFDYQDWAQVDGVMIARTGDAVEPGSAEVFDDNTYAYTFRGIAVNDSGSVVLAGRTAGNDDVIALAGDRVLLRSGDAVDIDADGLPDDDLYVNEVGEGSVWFTADQRLFAVVTLVNGANSLRGVAFITLDARQCGDVDFNNDGLFPDTQDIADFLGVFAGAACPTGGCDGVDFNRDGLFPDTDDIGAFLRVFGGGGCP